MKPKVINTPFYLFPSHSKVIFEPLGCILILGPYNYPILYIFKPLVNIIAAGNTALIKPSEKCPNTSKLIKKLTSRYFENYTIFTLEGDYKEAIKLAKKDLKRTLKAINIFYQFNFFYSCLVCSISLKKILSKKSV